MIPPEQNAAFVAQMESVLALYGQPYDSMQPVVCLDERPCMLHGDLLEPLSMKPGQDLRYDHEYIRNGSCCVLMAFEPLKAWRHAWVRPQRRRLEFAEVVRELLDQVYPDVNKIRLVCDNLNTHNAASFYERYPPAQARAMAERIEFVYTPVHGSWLNVVEIEFSAMVRQCLDRRLATLKDVEREVTAWVDERNRNQNTVEWQMTTDDARTKLKRLYPTL